MHALGQPEAKTKRSGRNCENGTGSIFQNVSPDLPKKVRQSFVSSLKIEPQLLSSIQESKARRCTECDSRAEWHWHWSHCSRSCSAIQLPSSRKGHLALFN